MAYGVKQLRKLQLGLETNKGTPVAATIMWRGTGVANNQQDVVIPPENIGYLGPYDRAYTQKYGVTVPIDETEATFEQIGYPLSAGVAATVTGSANGGSTNGYTYAYALATTALPTVKSYTIEGGDNSQAYEYEYAFCQEIKLSGASGQPVKVFSNWFARQETKTTFTSLTPQAVEEILFGKGKIYADAVGGTIGTTQLAGTWLAFDMTIKTGLIAVYTGDGQLYFTFDKCVLPDVTGSFTFENDASGIAAKDDFVAMTTKKYRMAFLGSALTGTGGTFSTKALQIDLCPKFTSVDPLGEINGNNIIKVNWRAVFNSTANLYCSLTVCNILSALV
jgi:hypothetical protein